MEMGVGMADKIVKSPLVKRLNRTNYFVIGVLGMGFATCQSLVNRICESFGQGSTQMGMMISLFFVGMVISALISGELGERKGIKFTTICGFLLSIIGTALIGFAPSMVIASIGLVLSGAGFGAVETMGTNTISEYNPEDSAKMINITMAFFSLGSVIAPQIISLFFSAEKGWRAAYLILPLLMSAAMFLLWSVPYGQKTEKKTQAIPDQGGLISLKLLKNPVYLLYLFMILFYVGSESGCSYWYVSYFEDVFSNPDLGQTALSVFWAMSIVARFTASLIQNQRMLMAVGFFGAAMGILGFVLLPGAVLKLICVGITSLFMGPIWTGLFALGGMQHKKHSSAAFGVMMVFSSMGGVLVQPVIGRIVDGSPVAMAYWTLFIICTAMSALMLLTNALEKSRSKRDAAAE